MKETQTSLNPKTAAGGTGSCFSLLSQRSKKLLDLLVLFIYLGLTLTIVLHHEPWRDEALPWLMARDSSFFELIFQNLRYEPHPMAWYVVLYLLTHLGLPYIALSLVHLGITFSAVTLFVWKAPFHRIIKYAFVFSFYIMSEYATIARNYSISILALFCVAACYRKRFARPLLYGALVLFLFNTEFLCFTAGVGLVALYGWEVFLKKNGGKNTTTGFFIMSFGLLMAIWQILRIPADHGSWLGERAVASDVLTAAISRMFFPVFWDVPSGAALAIGWGVLFLSFLYFSRKPPLVFLALSAYAGIVHILIFKYRAPEIVRLRHFGFLIMILFFVLWLRNEYPARKWVFFRSLEKQEKFFSQVYAFLMAVIVACFLISIKYVYFTFRMDYARPYSGAKMMAETIREVSERAGWQKEVIVTFPHALMTSIVPYLPERVFWDPQRKGYKTYVLDRVLPDEDRKLTAREAIVRAGIQFQDISHLLFVFQEPLPFSEAYGYAFQQIYAADKGVWGEGVERFFLYKAFAKPKESRALK